MTTFRNELRQASYTTPRLDVFQMVPSTAVSVLDVGCSNGALGSSLRTARSGRKVIGVEGDAAFLSEATTCLDRVIHADLNALEWANAFSDTEFDCIIFADVLEHLFDPRKQLIQAKRCLRSGGCFVISLPNIRHVSSLYSIFMRGTFPRRERGIFDRTHLHWFTMRDAKELITDVGMKIEAMSYCLRLGDRGGGMLNKIACRVLDPVQTCFPIREFFTYQYCLRAIKK
jgi:methionine biosynthesis protein MetW